jgi:DNA repair exonuclease SbcCD nuclease subunit
MTLFKKAVALTDIHFGRNSNSAQANQDNLDFIEWFVEEAKTWGAETCLMLGDWHDNRHSLAVSTMDYSLRGMEMLNDAFERVIWIPGNHDLLYRDKRDVSSIVFAKHLPNIQVIGQPTTIGDVTLLPWLVNDEAKHLKNMKSRYVFSHLELPGFMMNAKVAMPHYANGVTPDDFVSPEYVFSGHFHFRQAKGKVAYIGNVMPFNFADEGDDDRGMMMLEWGKDPYFKAWPGQPTFRVMKLSDLLNEPDKHLKAKLTARVSLDIDISFEEAQVIKDEYISAYGLRKIELVHQPKTSVSAQDFNSDVVFQSVDQIVVDGLTSVQSKGLSSDKLIEIYKALPNL